MSPSHAMGSMIWFVTNRKKRRYSGKRITSGSNLIDWFFNKSILALDTKVKKIELVKSIREKGEGGLYGLYLDVNEIYLSAAKIRHPTRMDITRTLFHEALHAAFERCPEYPICILEWILWKKLHPKQKSILLSYVPRITKRTVKYFK